MNSADPNVCNDSAISFKYETAELLFTTADPLAVRRDLNEEGCKERCVDLDGCVVYEWRDAFVFFATDQSSNDEDIPFPPLYVLVSETAMRRIYTIVANMAAQLLVLSKSCARCSTTLNMAILVCFPKVIAILSPLTIVLIRQISWCVSESLFFSLVFCSHIPLHAGVHCMIQ